MRRALGYTEIGAGIFVISMLFCLEQTVLNIADNLIDGAIVEYVPN